jgi:flagellar biosynthesis protein FlgN
MINDGRTGTLNMDGLNCILQLELEIARVFLALLEREQIALAEGNVDDLPLLAADKDRIVAQLKNLDLQRNQHLAAFGLPQDANGMKAWISNFNEDHSVSGNWEELLKLGHQARQINQANAVIVTSCLQHTRRALHALQVAAGQVTLYNPKGMAI